MRDGFIEEAEVSVDQTPVILNKATVVDSDGRTIHIRKLTALDRMRLFEMLGTSLSDNISYLGYAMIACSVTKIDAESIAFPTAKRTLEATVSKLGDEGLTAVAAGVREHFRQGESGDLAEVKN